MKQRRDTFANWAAENPVLLDGELGIVSDDPNLYKVGDGRTEWNNLPFRGFDGTLAQELGTSPNAVISQKVVSEKLAELPKKEGYFPKMSVGFADGLSGHGESTPEEFTFRASGGRSIKDGTARIKTLRGNSIVANGKLLHSHIEAIKSVGDNAWNEQWENGGIRENNGEEYASPSIRSGYIRVLPDTQYYFKKPLGVLTYLYYYDADKNFVGWADPFATSSEGGVFTTMDAAYMRFTCLQADYNNGIMITLVHSGWKVDTDAGYQPYWEDVLVLDKRIREAFPDGMKSAGQASDMAYNKNGKAIVTKRISSIDLGSLTWGIDSSGFAYSQTTIPAAVDSSGVSRNVICASFGVKQDAYWTPSTENVIMIAEQGKLFITGNILSGITVNELKSQLEGVILFYESNAPTTYEVGEPFNFDYRVADFGTEEILTSEPSAPISADIIYQFNAVDQIRENYAEIEKIKAALIKAGFTLDW